ncbi:MAG TPA: sugar phosphate isomerase/epimerase [Chloroflexia bacterium]|nr:sugar phosphate isomerase/epimerase [Chloroflexia bacterium]
METQSVVGSAGSTVVPGDAAQPQSRCLPGVWRLTGALCPAAGPFAPLLFAGRLDEGIAALGALGYDACELSLRDPGEVDPGWLEDALAASGLVVSNVATGRAYYEEGLSLASPDPAVRRASVERLAEHSRLAARLGSALTIGGIRGLLPKDGTAPARRADAAAAFGEAAAYAASLGVQVLLEPINRYETNYLNTAEQALEFLEEARSPQAQLLLDTFHMNIEEVSISEAFRQAGARLGYVHFVDSNRRAPGSGHTDFDAVLRALEETGYGGYLGMEILPWPDDASAARLGLDNTRRIVSRHQASAIS